MITVEKAIWAILASVIGICIAILLMASVGVFEK